MRTVRNGILGLIGAVSLMGCTDGEDAVQPKPTAKPVAKKVIPKPLPTAAPTVTKRTDGDYASQAQALVAAIDEGKDAKTVGEMAGQLTQVGLSMLPALIEKHPECKV